MRGIHLAPFSIAKMRRIKKWQADNQAMIITIETERSVFDEVEIIKITKDDFGQGWLEFWGLDYRGYREWLIKIDDLHEVRIA